MTGVDSFLVGQSLSSKAMYQLCKAMTTGVIRIWTRMRVEGRENLPTTGAYVLAPIHRSYVDTPIAAGVARRRLRFMGKDTMWKKRWSSWLLSSVGGFPVTRGTADIEALKRAVQLLQGGEPLVLFPEGERKSGPTVQPLFEGACWIAARCGVPIIPVGIGGSERVMPKGAKFVYPHKVVVIIGAPIVPQMAENGRAPRSEIKRLSAQLHHDLQELFDRAQLKAGVSPAA